VVLVAFKAIDSVLRGQNGGFDSHTLPPTLFLQDDLRANFSTVTVSRIDS
jgi:hypothetical protein